MIIKKIPRLIIAAPQSSSGKTIITCGLLAALKKRRLRVQAYKIGSDYIDIGWHELASGDVSHNLDSWLVGKDNLKKIFVETSIDADISIIEGVMGLYDGGIDGVSSTAEIAKLLDAPVILIIDAKSIGASIAALVLGFKNFDKNLNIAGVVLNRVGSKSHKKIIIDSLKKINVKILGVIERNEKFKLPERHLGLIPTSEEGNIETIKNISAEIEKQIDMDALISIAQNTSSLEKISSPIVGKRTQVKIAVAKDSAFNFYYEKSLKEFERRGAEIVFFSPLESTILPKNISGIVIGGGFPEMFAAQLQANKKIRQQILFLTERSMPILAECGGFMYLMRELVDLDGNSFEMCGVFDNSTVMTNKLQRFGYIEVEILKNCVIGESGEKFHAHEFHFSKVLKNSNNGIFKCTRIQTDETYLSGMLRKNVVASYLHTHFKGCPNLVDSFIKSCEEFRRSL